MEHDEREQALVKLGEVYEAGKEYFEAGEHYSYEDYCKTLGKLTTGFGGCVQDTGGHVLVAYIPTGKHHIIGVTDENVVLSYSREVVKDLAEAAWDSTEVGAISYCDKTGVFFQLPVDVGPYEEREKWAAAYWYAALEKILKAFSESEQAQIRTKLGDYTLGYLGLTYGLKYG